MNYRVFWSPDAELHFEELIHSFPSETALLTSAAKAIDSKLLSDPHDFGESRFENLRVGFTQPLAVLIEVMEDVRTVIVIDVWRIDQAQK